MFDESRLTWPRTRGFAFVVAATLIVFATTNVISASSAQSIARNAALLSTEIGTASPSAIVVRIAGPKTIDDSSRTGGGITVYLGVVPAAQVKGQGVGMMHGGAPKGPHDYHIVAAVFDAATGARISDAMVTAKVSGLTLSGTETRLEPMDIANTITYGGFVRLPGADLYEIRLTIQRPAVDRSVVLEFKYDHR
jgi:hypothetical protein